jgi:hypothetical protein
MALAYVVGKLERREATWRKLEFLIARLLAFPLAR